LQLLLAMLEGYRYLTHIQLRVRTKVSRSGTNAKTVTFPQALRWKAPGPRVGYVDSTLSTQSPILFSWRAPLVSGGSSHFRRLLAIISVVSSKSWAPPRYFHSVLIFVFQEFEGLGIDE
jgi:hypothetical protein